ncbi:MAG TPA: methyl-accepting chemotaxis protein [Bryobacteraceae bacterium]|nr:methyl-accepting chemotaxis protein [Bryobacteraceae bacterium]
MKTTVANNLFAGFAIVLVFTCGAGLTSYSSLTGLTDAAGQRFKTQAALQSCEKLLLGAMNAEMAARAFLLTDERRYLPSIQAAKDSTREEIRRLRELTSDNAVQQKRLDDLNALTEDEFLLLQSLIARRIDRTAQVKLISKGSAQMDSIVAGIGVIRAEELALVADRDKGANSTTRRARDLILYGGFLALGSIALVSIVIRRGLREATGQARVTARTLTAAVEQIVTSTRQQAASTGEQAAAAVQANATMQEISRSGLQIASRAKEASSMAERVSEAGKAGLGAVQNTDLAMAAIREHAEAVAENAVSLSSKTETVGEIAATVNEIAHQSHLLALNAAIQAAAAGEHGHAFAVVASEIKSLADQSREVTVQVRSILGDIRKSVNKSVTLAEEAVKRAEFGKQHAEVAAGTVREIHDGIQQSMHAVQQIAASTEEQQAAFQQAAQAFAGMGHAGEQTAIGTRQLASSVTHLMTLGQEMAQAIDRYQV